MTEKLAVSVKEAAALLSIARNSVYAAVWRGELPYIKIGKRILIPKKALDEMLNVTRTR